jgi:hypothetical protein
VIILGKLWQQERIQRNIKNQAGGGKTAPRFSLRRRNFLPVWKTLRTPVSPARGFFKNQPHNLLQRGIETGWLRPYLSSTSQLGPEALVIQGNIVEIQAPTDPLSTMFREIRTRMLCDSVVCSVSHCPQACNPGAHTIASLGLNCANEPMCRQDRVLLYI